MSGQPDLTRMPGTNYSSTQGEKSGLDSPAADSVLKELAAAVFAQGTEKGVLDNPKSLYFRFAAHLGHMVLMQITGAVSKQQQERANGKSLEQAAE